MRPWWLDGSIARYLDYLKYFVFTWVPYILNVINFFFYIFQKFWISFNTIIFMHFWIVMYVSCTRLKPFLDMVNSLWCQQHRKSEITDTTSEPPEMGFNADVCWMLSLAPFIICYHYFQEPDILDYFQTVKDSR